MLAAVLRLAITQRFPEIEVTMPPPPGAAIVIPAKHTEVGDISIWDDGSEATLVLGEITHGHFADYTPNISAEEAERTISETLVQFLEALFDDRVLLWKQPSGSGGWRMLPGSDLPHVRSDAGTQYYLWSGPIG